MAARFSQVVGETRAYEQDIVGDTVSSAAWDVVPTGPTISNPLTTPTSATMLFYSSQHGSFLVTVTIDLVSGQRVKGQARIDVTKDSV